MLSIEKSYSIPQEIVGKTNYFDTSILYTKKKQVFVLKFQFKIENLKKVLQLNKKKNSLSYKLTTSSFTC